METWITEQIAKKNPNAQISNDALHVILKRIYELDKNRIKEKFEYHFGVYPKSLHFWLSISYRILRRIKLLFLKIKFQQKVKEFSKRENFGFMD